MPRQIGPQSGTAEWALATAASLGSGTLQVPTRGTIMEALTWPGPWPVDTIIQELQRGDTLARIVEPRRAVSDRDVREHAFELLVENVMKAQFGAASVAVRKPIQSTLGLIERRFPGTAIPDVAVFHGGRTHFCEVKSSRVDYNRFDNVFESKAFRAYLAGLGHQGGPPWEVEQDLIKLRLFRELSDVVGSCLFMMLDAYAGPGRSWTATFSDRRTFVSTMQTELVRGWTSELLNATRIERVIAPGVSANLIVCEVCR